MNLPEAPAWLRIAWRELRGGAGKLALPAACIALAVAGQGSVRHFAGLVDRALDQEARGMAGADLEISSPRPLTPGTLAAARGALPPDSRHATAKEFITMARRPDGPETRLVEVRAVGDGFPFYGGLEIEPALPMSELAAPVAAGEPAPAFAQPELLPQLGLRVGEIFALGNREFRLRALVRREPGPGGAAFALGPRVWIHDARLAETGLEQAGSRIRYRNLFALPEAQAGREPPEAELAAARTALEGAIADPAFRIRTFRESNPQLRSFFERLERFLGVLSLFIFLLAGVGVMSAIRAHLRSRVAVVAVLRCLGASRGQVLAIFTAQAALLGLLGGLAGVAIGFLTAGALPRLIGDLITLPTGVPPLGALLMAWGMGTAVTVLFALLALVELPALKPILLLRPGDALRPPRLPRLAAGALVAGAFYAVAWAETDSPGLAAGILGGTLAFFGLSFALFHAALTALARSTAFGTGPFAWRYGLRNLARTRARSALTLAVLGTATLLLASVSVLRHGMLEELGVASAGARPQLFLIDISDEQREPLTRALGELGEFELTWSRLIRARLVSVNGEAVRREEGEDAMNRSREMNLSERVEAYPTERVVAGEFWRDAWVAERDGPEAHVSIVESYAERAGLRLGDRLDFEIQGVPLPARVTSLRRVRWTTFQPNFFILFRPGALEGAPFQWIASLAGAPGPRKAAVQSRLAREFPTVTAIDIDEASDRLLRVAGRLEAVVRFLSLFTLLAGLGVLAALALENAQARSGEIALLKTLGAGRRTLLGALAAEYAGLGLLASGLGALGAWALGEFVLGARFGIRTTLASAGTLGLLGALALTVVLTGVLASARAFGVKAARVLKAE